MKTKSSKWIQRTAATLAALVFALVAGVCALSESKKVKAENNEIFVDTYYADYNGIYGYYSFVFLLNSEGYLLSNFSWANSDDSVDSSSITFGDDFNVESGDYWGDPTNFYLIIYSGNCIQMNEINSLSKNIKYNVSLSEDCNEYLENEAAYSLKYVLIEYEFTNNSNEKMNVELYLNYSDSIKQYIEQQQAEQNAIQENENLKRQGAIMIVIIISMIIGFCVLLFTRSR